MHYNRRGQLFDIRLGTSNDTNLDLEDPSYWSFTNGGWNRGALRLYFGAALNDYNSVNPSQPDNNGNIHRMDHFVPTALDGSGNITSWAMAADAYTYDQLNRLLNVTETPTGGSGSSFVQQYTYDRWGNRTSVTGQTAQSWDTTEAAATNRLKLASGNVCTGTKNGLCYDAAGNLIFDNQLGSAGDRTYDAEGRIITAAGGGTNKYVYDADGKRVRRQVGSAQYWQVYGIGGELVAEYQWNGTTATLQKEYGSGGGASIVAENAATVRWLVTDHLGTPRILADQTGSLGGIRRHDYYPFGEENLSGATIRTTGNGYQAEGVRQKFTGYERDTETNLDYAQARYYANVQGRFTSVDPLHSSAQGADPQSWNRYIYVGNRPLIVTDPSGLRWAQQLRGGQIHYQWFGTDEEYNKALQNGWEAVTFDESKPYSYLPNPKYGDLEYVLNPDGSNGWNPYASAVVADGSEVAGAAIGGPVLSRLFSAILGKLLGGVGGEITTLGLSEGVATEAGAVGGQAGRVVFSGHGAYEVIGNGMKYEMRTGLVTVPQGTSVTVYSPFGRLLTEEAAQAVELGTVGAGQFSKIYTSGMSMPNYTLFPVDGPMKVASGAVTVTQPTRLSGLLTPNMGGCHWAACTAVIK